MRAPALLLFVATALAACSRSNERIIDELEQKARAAPDVTADAMIDRDDRTVRLKNAPVALTLPMRSGLLPTVDGFVNGVAMPLMLDTGASLVSLTGAAAEATDLYIPSRPETRAISPGFDARYRQGVFQSLRLGPARFGNGVALVPMRQARGGHYAIVGCSVLGRYRATFDFGARTVHLEPAAKAGAPFFVPVEIAGKTYWLLVDTGASRLFLEPWVALELGLIDKQEAAFHDTKSEAFRSGRITRTRLDSLRVAGREFRDFPAAVVHTFGTEFSRGGLLGLAAFGKLAWTLDFSAKTIRLKG